jgi:hypothetical protein
MEKLVADIRKRYLEIFSKATKGKSEDSIFIGIGSFRQRTPPALFEEAIESIKGIHHNTALLVEVYF